MILDIYKDCFSRISIFSPSIEVDMTWRPVKDYIEKHAKVKNTTEEPIYFDHYTERPSEHTGDATQDH